jgi:hypothetical protein
MSILVIEIELPDADSARESSVDVAAEVLRAADGHAAWRFGPSARMAGIVDVGWMEES